MSCTAVVVVGFVESDDGEDAAEGEDRRIDENESDKCEEVLIVNFANAIIQPLAVMVKISNASIAGFTMLARCLHERRATTAIEFHVI